MSLCYTVCKKAMRCSSFYFALAVVFCHKLNAINTVKGVVCSSVIVITEPTVGHIVEKNISFAKYAHKILNLCTQIKKDV